MALILAFAAIAVVGQALNILLALTVERYFSSGASVVTFVALYLIVFWGAWRLALWITEPSRLLHRDRTQHHAS